MRISRRNHALLDFATAGFALVFPRVLGAGEQFTRVSTWIALNKIGYALLTRHELGAIQVLPMRAHLALDSAGGAALCALPFAFKEKQNRAVTACSVGLGVFDIVAAPLTETRSQPANVRAPDGLHRFSSARAVRAGHRNRLPTATIADTLKVLGRVALPAIAKGPIIRRPRFVAAAESKEWDTRAVQTLQALRARYGKGPLMLKLPFRRQAVLLDPAHVRRVLEESPEPFSPASSEKRAALSHFQPANVLISTGPQRAQRRRLNEQTLEHHCPVHHMARHFLPIVDEEVKRLLDQIQPAGDLQWADWFDTWFRVVRRIVFGDSARDDLRITHLLEKLRADANWAFAKPVNTGLRDELHERIRQYLVRSEPGSLVAHMLRMTESAEQAPEQQVPQWLFAFDPAGMGIFRALALLAAHPAQMKRARAEATDVADAERAHRPFLRATLLESLRLWPTTPLLLRQTTRETEWENGIMPAGTGILIFSSFFHRDEQNLQFAHTFHPDLWMEDDSEVQGFPPRRWPMVPFSGGPAHCPAQNLVLLLGSGALASLIGDRTFRLHDPRRLPPGHLPGTLDNYTLRFRVERAGIHANRVLPTMGG